MSSLSDSATDRLCAGSALRMPARGRPAACPRKRCRRPLRCMTRGSRPGRTGAGSGRYSGPRRRDLRSRPDRGRRLGRKRDPHVPGRGGPLGVPPGRAGGVSAGLRRGSRARLALLFRAAPQGRRVQAESRPSRPGCARESVSATASSSPPRTSTGSIAPAGASASSSCTATSSSPAARAVLASPSPTPPSTSDRRFPSAPTAPAVASAASCARTSSGSGRCWTLGTSSGSSASWRGPVGSSSWP